MGSADCLTGRCSLEAGKRHVDARNIIWLGTSNIGHELVFGYHENRSEQDKQMTREDLELTGLLRPRVSHCLGVCPLFLVENVISRLFDNLLWFPVSLQSFPSCLYAERKEGYCRGGRLCAR